jgi:hypothetical protein
MLGIIIADSAAGIVIILFTFKKLEYARVITYTRKEETIRIWGRNASFGLLESTKKVVNKIDVVHCF